MTLQLHRTLLLLELDTYDENQKWPGQPWYSYKCKQTAAAETPADKNLGKSLTEFLTPTIPLAELQARTGPRGEVSWLRTLQKKPDKAAFLVNGSLHGGAHMPLIVYTHNSQSKQSSDRREARNRKKWATTQPPWTCPAWETWGSPAGWPTWGDDQWASGTSTGWQR